jgi:hypothetical protein
MEIYTKKNREVLDHFSLKTSTVRVVVINIRFKADHPIVCDGFGWFPCSLKRPFEKDAQ